MADKKQLHSHAVQQQRYRERLVSSLSRNIDASSLEEVLLQREESSWAFFLPESLRTYHWEESLTADWLPHSERRKKNHHLWNKYPQYQQSPSSPKVFTTVQFRDTGGKQTAMRKCSGVKSDNCFLCIICLKVKQTNVFIWPYHSLKSCR